MRNVRVLTVPLLAAGLVAGIAPAASAAAARTGPARTAAAYSVKGRLTGVAATSARNAWAVGFAFETFKTVILRWNGTSWKRVSSPTPSAGASQTGVAAASATSAWTVGTTGDCGCGPGNTLGLRWNGHSWKRVSSPGGLGGALLAGVAAAPSRKAWAVGFTGCGCGPGTPPIKTLIVAWTGTAWKRTAHPDTQRGSLAAVAVTSSRNAWAVGSTDSGKTLILRWNGKFWK